MHHILLSLKTLVTASVALNVGVRGETNSEANLPFLVNRVGCTGKMVTKQFLRQQ